MKSDPTPEAKPGEPRIGLAYWNRPRHLSRWQRIWIAVVARVGAWMVGWIGRTLRWESRGDEHLEQIYRSGTRAIFTTWHGGIFPATWYWRDRGIVVMTSQNVDGEYIARIIESLGYGAARGSSSRGGMKALVEMSRKLRQGSDVGFTVDGPRGPRFSAKIGPVLLARQDRRRHFLFPCRASAQNRARQLGSISDPTALFASFDPQGCPDLRFAPSRRRGDST